MWNFILFILVVLPLVILGALVVGIHNNLARFRDEVEEAWSDIDLELGTRATLVDNLVETINKYSEYENSNLEKVIEAHSMLLYAETVKEIGEANDKLTVALEDLLKDVESHPDLKENEKFGKLVKELEENEYMLAEYQYLYNELAYVYNSKTKTFPSNAVASYFGFEDAELFETKKKLPFPR